MKCHHYGHPLGPPVSYTARMTLRIKELRLALGMTQGDLASKAGMSRSQLAMIEGGSRPANTLRLDSLAVALGVSTDHLFTQKDGQDDLFAVFRRLSPEDRQIVLTLAESLARKNAPDA